MAFLSRWRMDGNERSRPASTHAALIAELVNAARLAAVVTSMATARRLDLQLRFPGAFRAYLPQLPHVFQCSSATGTILTLREDCATSLQEFYSRVAFMSAISDLPADEWRRGSGLTNAEWRDLEDAWCRVCALASIAMHHMIDVSIDLDTFSPRQLYYIQRIVVAAKDGERPCVGSDGTVIVPGWYDRRQHERRILDWPISLEVDGQCEHGTLRDVSISGMGLSVSRFHPVGTQLIAHLQSGRRLAGRVQWSGNNRLGATFTSPLAQSDPLLVGDFSVAQ